MSVVAVEEEEEEEEEEDTAALIFCRMKPAKKSPSSFAGPRAVCRTMCAGGGSE